MRSRTAVVAFSAAIGLAGCATMTPEEAARGREANWRSFEQAQQAAQLAAQQANQAMMMTQAALLNATMVQPSPPPPVIAP